MGAYGDEKTQLHREKIREALVLNPRATLDEIVTLLQYANPPVTLHRDYVRRMLHKIKNERELRTNNQNMNVRLAEIQDRTETVIKQMWSILLSKNNAAKDRVMAGKVILDADHSLLNAQMDAGVFDRKLGKVSVEHAHEHTVKLPDEIRIPILRAMRNYGIIPKPHTVIPDRVDTPGSTVTG